MLENEFTGYTLSPDQNIVPLDMSVRVANEDNIIHYIYPDQPDYDGKLACILDSETLWVPLFSFDLDDFSPN